MLSNPIYYPYPAPKPIEHGGAFRAFGIGRIFYYYFLQALIFKGILYNMQE